MKQYTVIIAALSICCVLIQARTSIPENLRKISFKNKTDKKTGIIYKVTIEEVARVEIPAQGEKTFIVPASLKDNEYTFMRVAEHAPEYAASQLATEFQSGTERYSIIKLTGNHPGTFSFGDNYNPSQPFAPLIMLE